MSKNLFLIGVFVCGLLASPVRADTFKLSDGSEVSGDVIPSTANDGGVQIKTGDSTFQQISWTALSQDDLKRLAKNPKLAAFAEPFIESISAPKERQPLVKLKPPTRLDRVKAQSLLGAMCSSVLGFFVMVVLYSANIYAAYEIALFRARPVQLVCGVAAVLPVIGPIIFLSMPTLMPPPEVTPEEQAEAEAAAAAAAAAAASAEGVDPNNPMQADGVAHPSGLKLAHEEHKAHTQLPSTTYQRGQFTFNRRFMETKFSGFFGVVRRESEKDMVLVIKSARGEYIGQRISRIAANDLHLEVHKGSASEEVMIPFVEIQQIIHRHKDAH